MTKEERQKKLYVDVKAACDKLGYTIVTDERDFINNQSMIKYTCPVHGIQEKRATGLKQGKRCALCANETKWHKAVKSRSNNDDVRQKYYSTALDICAERGYMLLSHAEDFTGYKGYIMYKCEKHGEKSIRFGNLKSGKGCPDCQRENARGRFSFSPDEAKKQVEAMGGKLINSDKYINSMTENLLVECPRCHKNQFLTSLRHFTQHGGKVCSECFKKESNGERKVREWLEDNHIQFEQQKWFPDCRDINPLPFDFYIKERNTVIEFDGKQHFEDSHYFDHADTRFSNTLSYIQYHDNIKNNYCKEKGINLLRIPYNKMNHIDSILCDFLLA